MKERAKMNEKVEQVRLEHSKSKAEAEKKTQQMMEIRERNEALEQQVGHLKLEAANVSAGRVQVKRSVQKAEADVRKMETKLKDARETNHSLEERIKRASQERNCLREDAAKMEHQNEQLKSRIEALKSEDGGNGGGFFGGSRGNHRNI